MLATYKFYPHLNYTYKELEDFLYDSCRAFLAESKMPNGLRLHLSSRFWSLFDDGLASVYGIPVFERFSGERGYDVGFSRWDTTTYPDPMQTYVEHQHA